MIKGNGKFFVNGITLTDYFVDKHHVLSCVHSLKKYNKLLDYNVWALVQNGGNSGQSEAIKVINFNLFRLLFLED